MLSVSVLTCWHCIMWNWERVGYSSFIILLFQMKPAVFFRQRKEVCKCAIYLKFNQYFFSFQSYWFRDLLNYEKCFSFMYLDYCLLSDYWFFPAFWKVFIFTDLIRIADINCLLTDTTCVVQTWLVVINGNEFKPENIEYRPS